MQNEWILDVLTDLKGFARKNGLPNLADHLEDTCCVARAEMMGHTKGNGVGIHGQCAEIGRHHRKVGIR